MCATSRPYQKSLWILAGVLLLLPSRVTWGQVASAPPIGQGEVTANDVYVRSGPSANHYPVCKLSAGSPVTILSQSGEWYQIHPPAGVFSFIHGDYVDTADERSGVVNGINVRVRAGSVLEEFGQLKYVVQMKLSKGAEVTILSREPDGFLKISPPSGTSVYVHSQFVARNQNPSSASQPVRSELAGSAPVVGDDATAVAGDTSGADTPVGDAEQSTSAESVEVDAASGAPAVFGSLPPTAPRRALRTIDLDAQKELAKPAAEREFDPLLERYRAVAKVEDDDFAKSYAEARIDELSRMAGVHDALRKMKKLNEQAGLNRRRFLENRATLRKPLPSPQGGVEAQGELRRSALYPPGSLPRRFRLVDTTGGIERTIGYVEIPPGSTIDAEALVGRHVGVRASARRLQTGGVNPVPIYVARELIALHTPPVSGGAPRQD